MEADDENANCSRASCDIGGGDFARRRGTRVSAQPVKHVSLSRRFHIPGEADKDHQFIWSNLSAKSLQLVDMSRHLQAK